MNRIGTLRRDQRGATAIEYAIIAGLIGLGIVGSLVTTRGSLTGVFGTASSQMASGTAEAPVLKLNAGLPRASYWSAKTLADTPIQRTEQNSLGVYKTYQANFTDGSTIYLYYNINGKNYNLTTLDGATNSRVSIQADTSGFPGITTELFYSGAVGSTQIAKSYHGDNSMIYADDGYDKGYPLKQTTYTYNSDGSVASQTNGAITAEFKSAIQAALQDAVLFKDASK